MRDVWLQVAEFKIWLRKDVTDDTRAYYSYCNSKISAKLSDIRKHVATKKQLRMDHLSSLCAMNFDDSSTASPIKNAWNHMHTYNKKCFGSSFLRGSAKRYG